MMFMKIVLALAGKHIAGPRSAIQQPEDGGDDVERFKDVDEEAEEQADKQDDKEAEGGRRAWPPEGGYDPRAREPMYSRAERSCW